MIIRAMQGTRSAIFVTTNASEGFGASGEAPALTFERSGSAYVLTSVWDSRHNGYELPVK